MPFNCAFCKPGLWQDYVGNVAILWPAVQVLLEIPCNAVLAGFQL